MPSVLLCSALGSEGPEGGLRTLAGRGCVALGLLHAIANLWLVFGRPWSHLRRHSTLDTFRTASPFPILGGLLACLGCVLAVGDSAAAAVALVTITIDPSGLDKFVAFTWAEPEIWGPPWSSTLAPRADRGPKPPRPK